MSQTPDPNPLAPLTADAVLNVTAAQHPLQPHVDAILKGLPHFGLTEMQLRDLYNALPEAPGRYRQLGAEFSIKMEVAEQLTTVQHLRKKLLKQDLTPQDSASVSEIKSLITLSNSLLSTLMKFNKEIDRDHRLAQIEKALIDAAKTLPEAAKAELMRVLEERLENVVL